MSPNVTETIVSNNVPAADERPYLERQYREIAALAGGLAHEIRNPLSTISLNLDLLMEDLAGMQGPVAQRMQRKLSTIQKECEHLDCILEAFLQFARAGELTLEPCDVGDFIRKFLEFYRPEAERHGIDIRLHVAGNLPVVQLDTRMMRQVLSNLVRNSQQAMPNGGLIEIQAYQAGTQVRIEIIDNGCGIPAPVMEKIFQLFYSTKPSGNGLGLPTVRKIMEVHGGGIECDSTPGRGTKMTLILPVKESFAE
jgi:two-component system sensor histidine kinase HydH